MAKLRREHVMIARGMLARDASIRDVAGKLGVDESTLRYRLKRPLEAPDGRRDRGTALDGWDAVVTAVLERFGDARVTAQGTGRCPARVVFDVLVREFGFLGSYQAVRRHLKRTYGAAPVQAIPPRGDARRRSPPTVVPPTPLGARARLQLAGLSLPNPATIARPLSAYVALVEEARR
jgi:hypothetical protein